MFGGALGGLLGGGGGGALGGLLGGGNGNILGSLGGIVGGMFGGPIGSMIGSALGNRMNDAVGGATKDAAKQLHKEDGMPKFILDLVNENVDKALQGLKSDAPDAGTTNHVQEKYGDAFRDFTTALTQSIVDAVRKELKSGNGTEEAGGSSPSKGGKTSGGSWMQAIARAMGEVMGKKAARMVELSQKIQSLSDQQADKAGKADAPGATKEAGADNKEATDKENASKMEAAAETQRLNTEFQATGQEFNLLQTTFSTAIKTLGEGMAAIARKQ